MAIRCPSCGKFLSSKDKVCSNCGTPIGVAPAKVEVKEKPAEKVEVTKEVSYEIEDGVISDAPAVIRPDAGPIIVTKYRNVYVEKEPTFTEKSYFDGKFHQFLGWFLLGLLVTIITAGILFPLMYGWLVKWEAKHTVINGYREVFDGKAGSLIGWWILWMLLTIITLTIFGWWTPIRLRKWKVQRLKLVKDPKAK